jgi:Protein of unknown function (DUF1353).
MARFLNPLVYTRLNSVWVKLDEPLHFEFTLREVLGSYPPQLREIAALTGIGIDIPIVANAPKGYVTDLASIPKALHWLYKPDGDHAAAAVIHDIVYQTLCKHYEMPTQPKSITSMRLLNKHHTRFMADRLFLLGMRVLGVGRVKRTAFYNAVRRFGKPYYGDDDVYLSYDTAFDSGCTQRSAKESCRILTKGNNDEWDVCPLNENPCKQIYLAMPYDVFTHVPQNRPQFICGGDDTTLVWYPNIARPFLIVPYSTLN